ncbi:iron chelate uptake ABC transporter family permease subunit [Streptomyces mirabilis]|uniref:iron chelate uptake ABC transporter family permease subunit n=1 Tax=Streptomyces mirabilis TaxID=68239 RepID=UPI003D9F9EAE
MTDTLRTPRTASARPGGVRARQRRRTALLGCCAAAALCALATVSLASGEVPMAPSVALRALLGLGDAGDVFVVQEFRAPRLGAAIVAGASLAAAGAVLQRLFRNPLASPDVMGITGGASFGSVALLAVGASQSLIPVGALGGGMLAAVLLGVFAWRSGLAVARLVLVGLAVQAGLAAADSVPGGTSLTQRSRLAADAEQKRTAFSDFDSLVDAVGAPDEQPSAQRLDGMERVLFTLARHQGIDPDTSS